MKRSIKIFITAILMVSVSTKELKFDTDDEQNIEYRNLIESMNDPSLGKAELAQEVRGILQKTFDQYQQDEDDVIFNRFFDFDIQDFMNDIQLKRVSFQELLESAKEMIDFGILESLERNDDFYTFNDELKRIFYRFKFVNYEYVLNKSQQSEEEKVKMSNQLALTVKEAIKAYFQKENVQQLYDVEQIKELKYKFDEQFQQFIKQVFADIKVYQQNLSIFAQIQVNREIYLLKSLQLLSNQMILDPSNKNVFEKYQVYMQYYLSTVSNENAIKYLQHFLNMRQNLIKFYKIQGSEQSNEQQTTENWQKQSLELARQIYDYVIYLSSYKKYSNYQLLQFYQTLFNMQINVFNSEQIQSVLSTIKEQDIFEIEDKRLKSTLLYLVIHNYKEFFQIKQDYLVDFVTQNLLYMMALNTNTLSHKIVHFIIKNYNVQEHEEKYNKNLLIEICKFYILQYDHDLHFDHQFTQQLIDFDQYLDARLEKNEFIQKYYTTIKISNLILYFQFYNYYQNNKVQLAEDQNMTIVFKKNIDEVIQDQFIIVILQMILDTSQSDRNLVVSQFRNQICDKKINALKYNNPNFKIDIDFYDKSLDRSVDSMKKVSVDSMEINQSLLNISKSMRMSRIETEMKDKEIDNKQILKDLSNDSESDDDLLEESDDRRQKAKKRKKNQEDDSFMSEREPKQENKKPTITKYIAGFNLNSEERRFINDPQLMDNMIKNMDMEGNVKIQTKDGVTRISLISIIKDGSDCHKAYLEALSKL